MRPKSPDLPPRKLVYNCGLCALPLVYLCGTHFGVHLRTPATAAKDNIYPCFGLGIKQTNMFMCNWCLKFGCLLDLVFLGFCVLQVVGIDLFICFVM